MMRAWGARADTAVCDEPFYANYLQRTGRAHPGRDDVIAAHETDWDAVVRFLTGPPPGARRVFYQKHMAQHLPDDLPADPAADDPRLRFIDKLTNVLLIREPREVITSFIKVWPNPTAAEVGLPQQMWLHDRLTARGAPPPIVDARDVLEDPRRMLSLLCDAVGVPFDEAMLSWPPGPRDTDGVWAPHWYAGVYKSTGFGQYRPKNEDVPAHLSAVLDACNAFYDKLHALRLR